MCFGLLATLIVVVNLLAILVFHFLLISLAVADAVVGLLTVPLYIAISTVLYSGQPYLLLRLVYQLTDILTGIASIFVLASISLERIYAIDWPFRHRGLIFCICIFVIAIPWILTAIFTSISFLAYLSVISKENLLQPLILFLTTPLLVMFFLEFYLFFSLFYMHRCYAARHYIYYTTLQYADKTRLTKPFASTGRKFTYCLLKQLFIQNYGNSNINC